MLAAVIVYALLVAAGPMAWAQVPAQRGVVRPSASATADVQTGSYHALVIGINQYRQPLPNLKTAVNDAQAIARILTDRYGFQIKLLLNADATRTNILNALNQYRRSLRANDNLLIYYAGHGQSDKEADKAYWLPADAEKDFNTSWIIADELTTDIRVLPARHVLIISDSCYSGGLTRDANLSVRPDDQKVFLAKMLASRSRTLMSSGGDEPVADGGPGGHSVFANAVLTALEQATGDAFTAGDLFHSFVQQRVAGRSDQIPRYSLIRNSDHDDGDFVFTRKGASGPAPILSAELSAPTASKGGAVGTRAEASWEELRQAPARVVALVRHGKALAAADGSAQVYVSTENGARWTSAAMPDPKATIATLVSCGSLLFAGARNEGRTTGTALFVSKDNGATWQPTALEGNRVSALSCAGTTLVAGMWPRTDRVNGAFHALNMRGDVIGDVVYPTLVLSSDGGNTWELLRKRFDLVSAAVTDRRIEVFGKDKAGTGLDVLGRDFCYKTEDWTCSALHSKFSGGLPTALQRSGDVLFAGTRVGSIMVSANDGAIWKETLLPFQTKNPTDNQGARLAGFPEEVTAITTANGRVIAGTHDQGVFLGDARGETWVSLGDRPLTGLRCLAYDDTFLYAATAEGFYRIRLVN